MRLVRAELLKARRRQATWVLLIAMLAIMGLIYLVAGIGFRALGAIEFPGAYALIGQFGFGLGGLLALVYAAALVGADWNWGVIRQVIARGESRTNYLLAKAAALAILLGIALVIIFAFGIVMTYVSGAIWGVPVASPLRGRGLFNLIDWLVLTYPVLLQRAAIGMAVAVILRSQLAGAIVGVVLFLGEPIVRLMFIGLTAAGAGLGDFVGGIHRLGLQWWQFLPITVGDYVANAAPGSVNLQSSFEGLFIEPVPLVLGLPAVLVYLALTVGAAVLAFNGQEIA
jgi:ABC-type transport system involved in multi-copper enzyme maturation permease subunit